MRLRTVIVFSLITLVVFFAAPAVLAHYVPFGGTEEETAPDEELDNKIEDLQEKIEEYEKKIGKLEKQEQSLSKDIEYANSQISILELKVQSVLAQIEQKTAQIGRLGSDIEKLKNRIERLGASIDYQQDVLSERMRTRYKVYDSSPLVVLLGGATLNNLVQKTKYLKSMEIQDTKLVKEMKRTKDDFSLQKNLFEQKKAQAEDLKAQIEQEKNNLVSYQNELERQKKDKEELLRKTENDENKYQQLLAQVKSELAALQLAIDLPSGDGEEVEEGDVIGFMGNTGCSSGPHLHFGYVKDGRSKDPLPELNKGNLEWPVSNWQITQYFGENYSFYMNNFGIPGHDALDIGSNSQWSGAPIKAAKDGVLYYAQDAKVYCPGLNNSIGKGAIIDHGDGERTIYWHLQ